MAFETAARVRDDTLESCEAPDLDERRSKAIAPPLEAQAARMNEEDDEDGSMYDVVSDDEGRAGIVRIGPAELQRTGGLVATDSDSDSAFCMSDDEGSAGIIRNGPAAARRDPRVPSSARAWSDDDGEGLPARLDAPRLHLQPAGDTAALDARDPHFSPHAEAAATAAAHARLMNQDPFLLGSGEQAKPRPSVHVPQAAKARSICSEDACTLILDGFPEDTDEREVRDWNYRQQRTGAIARIVQYEVGLFPSDDIRLRRGGHRRIVLEYVQPGGTAHMVGVRIGDVLVSIDGKKDFVEMSMDALHAFLNRSTVTLVFMGFAGRLEVEVRLKNPRPGPPWLTVAAHEVLIANSKSPLKVVDEVFFKPSEDAGILLVTTLGSSCPSSSRRHELHPSSTGGNEHEREVVSAVTDCGFEGTGGTFAAAAPGTAGVYELGDRDAKHILEWVYAHPSDLSSVYASGSVHDWEADFIKEEPPRIAPKGTSASPYPRAAPRMPGKCCAESAHDFAGDTSDSDTGRRDEDELPGEVLHCEI